MIYANKMPKFSIVYNAERNVPRVLEMTEFFWSFSNQAYKWNSTIISIINLKLKKKIPIVNAFCKHDWDDHIAACAKESSNQPRCIQIEWILSKPNE